MAHCAITPTDQGQGGLVPSAQTTLVRESSGTTTVVVSLGEFSGTTTVVFFGGACSLTTHADSIDAATNKLNKTFIIASVI